MDTNTIASIRDAAVSTIWSALAPHIATFTPPTVGIMILVRGTKMLVGPFLQRIGERRTKTIYRGFALAYGITWLWLFPMIWNYFHPTTGQAHYPIFIIIPGGIFLGFVNILAYDYIVSPIWHNVIVPAWRRFRNLDKEKK